MQFLKTICVALGLVILAVAAIAGAYFFAGGNFDRAKRTEIRFLPPRELGFGTLIGCGPADSTYETTLGLVQVSRHYGR